MDVETLKTRCLAPLATPTSLPSNAVNEIAAALTTLLTDVFTLYVKTKHFHWHLSGPHLRDHHLMLDEQGE
ncbi:DNA-binding ferritin-like protein [Ancylobacter vacuolatus]|uniref:DNA-binding ferritin-like protein n=1 Tax=Ancylobacter vacuolatus TaxID=223389 RepID=A0ABU0DK72_9HYPH|nr:DNA-binding ferritin-like protein [Ancylobacter vacuolatus]